MVAAHDVISSSWAYRVESMTIPALREFIYENLRDRATYMTFAFGPVKLFRYLLFPLDKYAITHDGIIFYGPNFHLVNKSTGYEASEDTIVRTYDAYSGKYDDYHELVRLTDSYGITKTYLVYRLVAKAFIHNPENFTRIDFLNGDMRDIHFQNLYWSAF